ncbi:hypothetical protein PUN28_009837 [Cardiocondyla obscurior]|uniref:Uncharacterized protein n=1 Tax=Cardiocondyla obscurior TaxID=286306 RepID=A0AAW2FNY3_9HYME
MANLEDIGEDKLLIDLDDAENFEKIRSTMEKMNVEVENTKPPARKETAAQQQPCPSCKGAAAQQQRPNESTSQQPRLILSIKRNETGHSSPFQELLAGNELAGTEAVDVAEAEAEALQNATTAKYNHGIYTKKYFKRIQLCYVGEVNFV